jgi:DNA mismatch endonuclease (patch repair protein)
LKETPEQRSRIMRAVKSRDTAPELIVRKMAFAMGYRYRLNRADLPGKPDIVFPGRGKIIFVHGCFWHGHDCKRGARTPSNNRDYWLRKLARNRERDQKAKAALTALGWSQLAIWECETKDARGIRRRLKKFLG